MCGKPTGSTSSTVPWSVHGIGALASTHVFGARGLCNSLVQCINKLTHILPFMAELTLSCPGMPSTIIEMSTYEALLRHCVNRGVRGRPLVDTQKAMAVNGSELRDACSPYAESNGMW